MKQLLVIAIIVPLLSACMPMANPKSSAMWDYHKNPNMSEALNIATAVGLNEDSDMQDATPKHSAVGPDSGGASDLRTAGTVAANAASVASGIMSVANASVNIASALTPTSHPPYSFDFIYAFIPASKAKTKKQAVSLIHSEIISAIYQFAKKHGYKIGEVKNPYLLQSGMMAAILGKDCNSSDYICSAASRAGIFNYGIAMVKKPPYFVGSEPIWYIKMNNANIYINIRDTREVKTATATSKLFISNGMMMAISKAVPELYIYQGTGFGPVPQAPYFIHDGKELRFVRPLQVQQRASK